MMKTRYVLFILFSILLFGVSNSQTKYSFSGLGGSSGGYKSIATSPTGANIIVSSSVVYLSPIFYHSAPGDNAFTIVIKRKDYLAFNFYDMTWRNFGVARTLAAGTKILFERGDLADVTWTLSAAALDGETSARTIFNESSAVTGVTKIIITGDLAGFSNTSNNIEFKDITLAFHPTVSTTTASNIDFTSVTLAGNATYDGDSEVTERGIVYSRTAYNSNPIINGYSVVKNSNGIGTGVFSESITGLISNVNYSFRAYAINEFGVGYGGVTTFRTLDNIPPIFVSNRSTPIDNATGVATTANIVVTFDENITKGTGFVNISDLISGLDFEVFDITSATATSTPVEGTLGILNDKLYINPTNELAQNNRYAINIASTAITDTSNNSFEGINDLVTFNFTTKETINPTFVSYYSTPKDNATGIATAANIVVDFDENITKGTGAITIRDVTGTANFEVFDIATATSTKTPAAGTLGVFNDKLYINPTNLLAESGNVYAIQIAATAIDDAFGNSFDGITDETTFNFTTANPSLGTYSDVTISSAGDNTIATPDAAPVDVTRITAYTDTNFKGEFSVNQLTGAVHITNAYPAGTYTVTVNTAEPSLQNTFALTVGNNFCSKALFTPAATPEITVGTGPGSVTIGDFNNDGIKDIASANYNSFNVSINLGLNSGGFAATTYISLGTIKPSSVSIGDFNGDGNQDIATANYGTDNVSIRLGDGTGGFTGSTNVTVGNGPQSVAIGDFNNDGIQDFAVANQNFNNGGSVSIRLGDGLGGFSGSTNISVGFDSKAVAIGDFNSDGNQDIAVSNPSSSFVSILIGNGAGVFSTGTNVAVASGCQSVVISDFNNDGSQDLAMSNYSTNKVFIKLGNGAGLFSGSSEVVVGTGVWSLAIGDFNGDGLQDIATSNRISGTVSIRLGDGLGGFSGTTELTVASNPQSLTIGDFNGDGLQDIATANSDSNSVSIHLGTVSNINLQGNAADITYEASTPLETNDTDFGNVTINTTASKTYTIQNTGTAPLTISSIASSGADATDFVVGDITLPATIAAGANSTFTLTLTATSIGEKTATVTINNDDCDEGTYTFAVKGVGWNAATWTGAVSSDWNVVGNWNNNVVPTATYYVTIPNVATTPNVISSVQIANLTIDASASFNIAPSGAVIVDGDLNSNEVITMESDATNSSTLFVKGTSTGNVMYKRGGLLANKWSIVSAPVQGQRIKEFAENAQNGIRINTSVTPNRYAIGYYDDSRAVGAKWVFYTTTDLAGNSLTFEKGKSYTISRATNGAITFTGTLETADVLQYVTGSKWNAVGNPYTTFLPLNENTGNNFINNNLNKFNPVNVGIYVWDTMQGKYVGRSLISDESSFAPGQGFFMKTSTGNSHVIFKESVRKTQPMSGGGFNKTSVNVTPSIKLKVASNGVILDTNIKYFENATIGLDPGYDLENFGRAVFDIYTHLVDAKINGNFTIQSLPNRNYDRMIIPVGVKSELGEDLSFSVDSSHLPEGMEVIIEDKELEVFTKLDVNTTYDVKTTVKLNGVGRFYLHTKQKALSVDDLRMKDVEIYSIDGNMLMVNGILHGDFNVKLYTVLGTAIVDKTVEGNGKNSIRLSNVSKGIYIVKVSSEFGNKSTKIIIK